MPHTRLFLLAGAALVLNAATCKTSHPQTMLKIISQKDDAQIQIAVDHERAVIQIFSASGIGHAGFEITSQELPKQITLRFHLRGLEELRFAYDETVATASLASTGEPRIHQSVSRAGEKPVQAQTVAANSEYWMKLRIVSKSKIPLQDGYIEVEAPAHFLASAARQATIHWIDFYR